MFGLDFTSRQKLAAMALIGISAIGLSFAFAKNAGFMGNGVTLREPSSGLIASDSDPIGGSDSQGMVVVHVSGAVSKPNVYSLPRGRRVIDAINAAGGALEDADIQALNLAEKLIDGSRINVPTKSPTGSTVMSYGHDASYETPEYTASSGAASKSSSKSSKFKNPGDGTVSINSASVSELQRLPGVGPSTAQKIVDHRKQIGSFRNVEQIMDVSGIGPKKLEKMRPFISL